MKKFLFLLIPLILAVVVFSVITIILNRSSGKGALQVTSTPASKVYLNDKLIGTTPLCRCELPDMLESGNYTAKLIPTEGDFKPFEEKISINKSTLTVVDRTFDNSASSQGSVISLSPLTGKKEIEILVISFPDKGNVFLDNNLVGSSPLLLKNVTESDHDLKISRDGYKSKSVRIRTALGYKLTSLVYLGIKELTISSQSAQNVASSSAVPTVKKAVILNTPTGFLRVRDDFSLAGAEIGRVSPGETFDIIDEKNGWFKIKLKDGTQGWISADYATLQ